MHLIRTIPFAIFFFITFSPILSFGLPIEEPSGKSVWDDLLKKHVDDNGRVNYSGFIEDKDLLNTYLKFLSNNPPNDSDSDHKKLAYWINAYNAFTIKLIIENYPLKSIKELGATIQIPFVNSPWDLKFFKIGDDKMCLNDIEHKILRKKFNEPRIHFAIVCASNSCPNLRNEAYSSELLESQMNEETIAFINDSSKNKITEESIEISKIFSWFKGDFTKNSSLIGFLNRYSNVPISEDAKVNFIKYDWGLNAPIDKGT